MSEITEQMTPEETMIERLTWATAQTAMLERELAAVRFERDDLILDLLGTKVSRKDISEAAGLAEISIYKIAARVRERRAALAAEPVEKKARSRKVKVKPVAVTMEATVVEENEPVVVDVPEGVHPLMGWTLAAA